VKASQTQTCKICSSQAVLVGVKRGKLKKETEFTLFQCDECGFAFIGNPWTDYEEIYCENYYRGRGADPLVDYVFEMESPDRTIRKYEWQGILTAVQSCVTLTPETRWLDFGCGNGGLVRYCRERKKCAVFGYEQGWIRDRAVTAGVPILSSDELRSLAGSFDIVTAIEVLEHIPDPLVELRRIRSLLKPSGLFFFTTMNTAPFRKNLIALPYVLPEIHVSFYEPQTVSVALKLAGFKPEFRGFIPGYEEIIRFKVLKNCKIRTTSMPSGIGL
jgi:SAM-dependent methyltransferase